MQQYVLKGRKGWLETIYKLKYFIFLSMKKHREKAKSTGKTQKKHRKFCLNGSVATLRKHSSRMGTARLPTVRALVAATRCR